MNFALSFLRCCIVAGVLSMLVGCPSATQEDMVRQALDKYEQHQDLQAIQLLEEASELKGAMDPNLGLTHIYLMSAIADGDQTSLGLAQKYSDQMRPPMHEHMAEVFYRFYRAALFVEEKKDSAADAELRSMCPQNMNEKLSACLIENLRTVTANAEVSGKRLDYEYSFLFSRALFARTRDERFLAIELSNYAMFDLSKAIEMKNSLIRIGGIPDVVRDSYCSTINSRILPIKRRTINDALYESERAYCESK